MVRVAFGMGFLHPWVRGVGVLPGHRASLGIISDDVTRHHHPGCDLVVFAPRRRLQLSRWLVWWLAVWRLRPRRHGRADRGAVGPFGDGEDMTTWAEAVVVLGAFVVMGIAMWRG